MMKTSRAFWTLTVLIVAVFILGITPAAAHDAVPRNQDTGSIPMSVDQPAPPKPDKADKKVDRFVSLLVSDGFTVQEGHANVASLQDICCIEAALADCTWFNAASPYMAAYLPLSPGQTSQELPWLRDPGYEDQAVAWRLRPDEAVVFVGLTPPPVRYFGFQTYRWFTFDEDGNRVRRWNNFGDQTNQLTIATAGTPNGTKGDPFNSLTMRITAADRGIEARVREAARRAGYPTSLMNTEPIPQSLVRMGIDQDADIFSWILRAALPEPGYEDALAAYKEAPEARVFRVTPNTAAPVYPEMSPDPFPIPEFRAHGTAQTEFGLLPAVRDLRRAILDQYDDQYVAEEFTSEQWFFYGLHHMDVNDDGLAPSTDALYLHLTETLGTLDPGEFVIAYGANHQQTGKAMYMNVTMYGTTKLIARDDVDDRQLAGTAADYLPADYPEVGKLYAYKFARQCNGEEHCYEVPYGCCNYQGTEYCAGEPCSAGMGAIEEAMLVWRSYLDPVSKTGPDPAEVLCDRAIKFSPKD